MSGEVRKKLSSNKHQLLRAVLFLWGVSIGIVCYLSLTPEIELPLGFKWDDLVYHSLAYLWLSILPFLGFQGLRTAITSAFLMFPLGVGLEVAQNLVPGRFFSITDIMANSFGVFLGILLGKYIRSAFPMK
jgi:VanZ family protein